MVLSADCLPVSLGCAAARSRCSTPAGAGWPPGCSRRACARCASSAQARRGARAAIGAAEIVAVIGPGAGPAAMRSGPRCTPRSGGAPPGEPLARRASLRADRPEGDRAASGCWRRRGSVHDVGLCTICDERFFSHRREGAARRAPGGHRVAELIARRARRARAREPRARARRARRGRRAARRARRGEDGRACWRRRSTSPRGPAGRSPRPACGWSARTARRTCRRRSRRTASCSSGTSSASCRAGACA